MQKCGRSNLELEKLIWHNEFYYNRTRTFALGAIPGFPFYLSPNSTSHIFVEPWATRINSVLFETSHVKEIDLCLEKSISALLRHFMFIFRLSTNGQHTAQNQPKMNTDQPYNVISVPTVPLILKWADKQRKKFTKQTFSNMPKRKALLVQYSQEKISKEKLH